jgi:hypothetical protein
MNAGIRPDSSLRGTGNQCSKSRNTTEDSPFRTYLGSSLQDLQGTLRQYRTSADKGSRGIVLYI